MKSIIKIISAKCKEAKREIDNPKKYRVRHFFTDEELENFKVRSWWYDGRHKRKYQDKSCHDEN
jgi:hypothetical protein